MKFFLFNSPNIGKYRELKKYTEKYWNNKNNKNYKNLIMIIKKIKFEKIFFQFNNNYSYISFGDFSAYDSVLDISCMINSVNNNKIINLEKYFLYARGGENIIPSKMTKFFNTNYHYLIPQDFSNLKILNISLLKDILNLLKIGILPIINIIGVISYIYLSINKKKKFKKIFEIFLLIIKKINFLGIKKIIFEEPILCCKINKNWEKMFFLFYKNINKENFFNFIFDFNIKNKKILNYINYYCNVSNNNIKKLFYNNIINNDLNKNNIFLSILKNNCNFLTIKNCKFIPYNLNIEKSLNIKYLSFFFQKNNELKLIKNILNKKINSYDLLYLNNFKIFKEKIIFNNISKKIEKKNYKINKKLLINNNIGSFPQNKEIKISRKNKKFLFLNLLEYENILKENIYLCILKQINLNYNLLTHGELERTDMVEYFAENIKGFLITKHGWIQSYGTRYVKPPIIMNIYNKNSFCKKWFFFSKKITNKKIKIILSGPITILKWSFYDNYMKFFYCLQLSEIINLEIIKFQLNGFNIFQIDEPTLKECLPNNKEKWKININNFLYCFNNCTKLIKKNNEIHSHICYSLFSDVVNFIKKINIDVLTIESTREKMLNLFFFRKININIGAGIYDVHSPIIINKYNIKKNIFFFSENINPIKFLINPDCGLKTRKWYELNFSLFNINNIINYIKNIYN